MTKSKKRLWIFLIILIYVVIAIVGFFVAYLIKGEIFHQPATNIPSTPSTTVQKKPTPAIPGWQTYTNAADNITFSYPPGDTIKTSSYGFGVTNLQIQTIKGNILDFQILLMPKTMAAAVGQNFDDYYALKNNTVKTIKSPLSSNNISETFIKINNRTINGLRAVDYQSIASNAKAGTQPEIGAFIEAGNNLVLFSTEESNKMNLEKILNTFKYQQ